MFRWRLGTEFGEPPEVLHRRYQQELIVRTLEPPESQSVKPKVPLHVGKHHFDFLALPDTGVDIFVTGVNGARLVTSILINTARYLSVRRIRATTFLQRAVFAISHAGTIDNSFGFSDSWEGLFELAATSL